MQKKRNIMIVHFFQPVSNTACDSVGVCHMMHLHVGKTCKNPLHPGCLLNSQVFAASRHRTQNTGNAINRLIKATFTRRFILYKPSRAPTTGFTAILTSINRITPDICKLYICSVSGRMSNCAISAPKRRCLALAPSP